MEGVREFGNAGMLVRGCGNEGMREYGDARVRGYGSAEVRGFRGCRGCYMGWGRADEARCVAGTDAMGTIAMVGRVGRQNPRDYVKNACV